MPDDINDIRSFYDNNVHKENDRLERHPVERDITWRYLESYLPPTGKILDIGAGTGAYSIPLAERGYSVTVVDLSTALIDKCKERAKETPLQDKLAFFVADARDLSETKDKDYDAVLLMGPLYHLVLEEDRIKAIKEAFSKMKRDGIIFSAFISRFGIWGDVMVKIPHYIKYQSSVKSILEKGVDAEDFPTWESSFRAYFATVSEIIPLHEKQGFKTLALAGVEPAGFNTDRYKDLTDEQRKQWLDLIFSISTERTAIGASTHLLYVGEKII